MERPTKQQLGSLDAYAISGNPDLPHIVLFHGYGASAFDLMPLSEMLLPDIDVSWVFPDGRIGVDIGFGMQGRAWFPIDLALMEKLVASGQPRDYASHEPEGFDEARQAGFAFLEALNVPMDQIILGGFSQGAMLATDLALRAAAPPRALLVLSGTMLDEENWRAKAPDRAGLPFFQCHGKSDPLLPYTAAERLNGLLKDAGLKGNLLSFEGGHEIPQDAAVALRTFLTGVIQQPR